LLALVLSSVGSTGCASKPTMKLKAAEISGVTLGFPPQIGVVMTMVIDVHNPNPYDVAIRAMRGTALLADKYTLPIDYRAGPEGVWLASKATTTMRVPVSVPVDLALRLLQESYMTPTVPFRVTGTADVTATRTFQIEKDNYSVDETGTFSRQQLEVALPHF
jgi:Late embryogenesis abundant protein